MRTHTSILLSGPVLLAVTLAIRSADAGVVINEIFYRPPDDLEDLEFIELHNTSAEAVDLAGWSLKGVELELQAPARIEGNGYAVLCRSRELFEERYEVPVLAVFRGRLGNGGDRIELRDPEGNVVDAVEYTDSPPWPMGPDGYSGSLERISPAAGGEDPSNWISSPLSPDRLAPGGTPGKVNHGYAAELPPVVSDVKAAPGSPAPGQEIRVEAVVRGDAGVREVNLLYRQAGPGFEKPETTVPMRKTSEERYEASIPGQAADVLIRYRVEAIGKGGARRSFPAETEPRPALSLYVMAPAEPALIPFGWIVQTVESEFNEARERSLRPERRGPFGRGGPRGPGRGPGERPPERGTDGPPQPGERREFGPPGGFGFRRDAPARGSISNRSAFVYFDPETRKVELFDFVKVIPRAGGYKVRFHRDAPLLGMTMVNLIFDNDRAVLAEPLAYSVYRKAGMAVPQSRHVRLWIDGRPVGYHAMIEQVTRAFLRKSGLSDGGHLYKLLWYESGVVGQHEKKTRKREGHEDLVELLGSIEKSSGAEQWEVIRNSFDVEQVATYFAVCMAISNWDGFFNNYFTYHDTKSGKWTMFPWDQDQTWGVAMSMTPGELFHDMPLTFGMEGDTPPGGGDEGRGRRRGFGGFGGFGGGGLPWWRPGGHFSRPLLANPEFRKVFLARVKAVLETVYTEETFGPVIDDMARRLEPEVRLRAEVTRMDPERAVEDLKLNLDGFREHLRKRREFLLSQEDLRSAALPPASPGLGGKLAASATWRAAEGPYVVSRNLTIEKGVTLTIEPGTEVHLEKGADLIVETGGRLLAAGSAEAPVRFSRPPGTRERWGGIVIEGERGSPETRIRHARIGGNGAVAIHCSRATVLLEDIRFETRDRQYLSLDESSFVVNRCHFPRTTGEFENVNGTGGILEGGRGVFRECFFGGSMGYSDLIDFTGSSRERGQPIIEFHDNVFTRSSDDGIDLDGTDAWIEGNIFVHVHRNGAPDTSSGVSGGASRRETSQVTIIRNLFFDCDHAVTAKEGNFFVLLHNTIVRMTKEGGVDTGDGAVCVRDMEPRITRFGQGVYLEGNVIADASSLVRYYEEKETTVTFTRNILPAPWTGPGEGNIVANPGLHHIPQLPATEFESWAEAQVLWQWFRLEPGSPALRAGPHGRDMGALVPRGVFLSGEPRGKTASTDAMLLVGIHRAGNGIPSVGWPGGSGYTHYRWRLDGGSWSAETPIETPIAISGLADGPHQVEAAGKRDTGTYQDDPLLGSDSVVTKSRRWFVESGAPAAGAAPVTYARDVRPLFEASCLECHGERRQRAGLRLDTLDGVLAGSDEGPVVIPGNSKESILARAVARVDERTAMPPRRGRGFFGLAGQGGARGGPGFPGGGGFGGRERMTLPSLFFDQADTDMDGRVTRSELADLGDIWFDRLDPRNAGRVAKDALGAGLEELLVTGRETPAGGADPELGRLVDGLLAAADADKDGALVRAELRDRFEQWFPEWGGRDGERGDSLSRGQIVRGWSAVLGQPAPGGPGGPAPGETGPDGREGPGRFFGFGGGGFGGGGFGRGALAERLLATGDADRNELLSRKELRDLLDAWFVELDSEKAGSVPQNRFLERLGKALAVEERNAGDAGGARPTDSIGTSLFAAADSGKDGSLTLTELAGAFDGWFTDWDSEKSGAIDLEKLSAGLREVLPREGGAGGFGQGQPGRQPFAQGQGQPGRQPAPEPRALTTEQVALIRTWIDQGAE